MYLDERSDQFWQRTNPGGNYSTNGYPTRAPQTLSPDQTALTGSLGALGDGVIGCGQTTGRQDSGGNYGPRFIHLIPYGVGATDTTFSFQVLGWTSTTGTFGNTSQPPLWIPVVLGVYNVIIGGSTGVAGSDLAVAQQFADSIVLASGGPSFINAAAPNTIPPIIEGWFVMVPADDAVAFLSIPTFGFRFIEVIFTTGGSATSCNALYRKR